MIGQAITSRETLIDSLADVIDDYVEECALLIDLTDQIVTIYIPEIISGEKPEMLGHDVVFVDFIPSHEAYEIMEDFAMSQPEAVAERLLDALSRRRPFRAFSDAIKRENLSTAWYEFKDMAIRKYAEDVLDELDVTVEDGRIVCKNRKNVSKFEL